ncbi:hypothetical protein [Nocardia colli]|uniref:hypothetical protein n=1 Tax=Nocardia colli TaxID=2545717 RepID=UPI00168D3198|nr:hypothetical protein [Nocardia colli]
MSAVAVAVIVGFVCCALVIRALGARGEDRRVQSVVEDDRVPAWRTADRASFDA